MCQVGPELFHADPMDRRTEMVKLIADFRKFANAPTNGFLFRAALYAPREILTAGIDSHYFYL